MKYNQLNGKNRYALYKLMEDNKPIANKRTDTENAEWATEELGFRVVAANIESARRDLEWSQRRMKIDSPQTAKQLNDRIAVIENWLDSNFPNWSE